jgi:hypothetical protein
VPRSDRAHDIRKRHRHPRGDLVAGLLGQARVAGEIGEDARLGSALGLAMNARVLERSLEMLEHVLSLELLGMPPVEPTEQLLARSARPDSHLADRRFEGGVVAQTLAAERLLDGPVLVVAHELRDLACAVSPHASEPEDVAFVDTRTHEDRDGLQE